MSNAVPMHRRDVASARTFGKRVLVVDAHPLVRWALLRMLQDSGDLVPTGEATTADEALSAVFAFSPDVVVIDGALADDGWELARTLRARSPLIGIVMLSVAACDKQLLRALDIGASSYMAKTAPIEDIMAAIRHAAVAPTSFNAPGLAQAMRRRMERGAQVTLTGRELQVLTLLRSGLSVPQVAATLYVSLSTAKTYVARLYDKLNAKNRAQALMTAVELGLFDEATSVAV